MKKARRSRLGQAGSGRRAVVRWAAAGAALAALAALGGWALSRSPDGPPPGPGAAVSARAPIDRALPPVCHDYLAEHEACAARSAGEAREREEQALATQRRVVQDAARNLATEGARRALAGACEQLREGLRSRCAGP